ncbi:MAG: ACT domain-containing protein [Thermoproteota archaeon]|nr:ACT domain-containing protein [Candidatus Brockarchaeota archaeon]
MASDEDKRFIVLRVVNMPGVMERISSIFARRAINIDTITVGMVNGKTSEISLTFSLPQEKFENIVKVLEKNPCVSEVKIGSLEYDVIREAFIAVLKDCDTSVSDYIRVRYRARTTLLSGSRLLVELLADPRTVDDFKEEFKDRIESFSRSGVMIHTLNRFRK